MSPPSAPPALSLRARELPNKRQMHCKEYSMSSPWEIKVTQQHIDNSKWTPSLQYCPISNAVWDMTLQEVPQKDIHSIIVCRETIQKVICDWKIKDVLPEEATTFIEDFDYGKEVEPITFECAGQHISQVQPTDEWFWPRSSILLEEVRCPILISDWSDEIFIARRRPIGRRPR